MNEPTPPPQPPSTAMNALIALYNAQRYAEVESQAYQLAGQYPSTVLVWKLLGAALQAQGKDAVPALQNAVKLSPNDAEPHNSLGMILQDRGQLDSALASYRTALKIEPGFVEAHYNLGNVLCELGQLENAVESYRNALKLNPDFAVIYSNLGAALRELGRFDEALANCRRALELDPGSVVVHGNLLGMLNCQPEMSAEEIYRAYQEYDARWFIPLRPTWRAHGNDRDPERRLRVGYVSPDFRRHAVAFFAEPILANHDKSKVEIFCYAEVTREDEVTSRFRQLADHWYSTVGMSDDMVAQMIRDHRIDILVDLAGHSTGNRLPVFARKPAPLQLTYLGYPGTTGLSAIDYRLTDRYADPEGSADAYYAEQLLRLPDSLCCYHPNADMPEISSLPALARGYLTFGSLNNFNKIDQPTLNLWADLLRALPTSRLMMITVPEGEPRKRLLRSFGDLGIAAQRLEFHGKLPAAEFYRKFLEVDITLDSASVSGGTTTCESLWMGVPVIALVGGRFITRVSYSFLSTAGLSNFAATSAEDYIRIAVDLADNLPQLAEIRAGLRDRLRTTPLTDEVGFTRNLEKLYREIWRKWCSVT